MKAQRKADLPKMLKRSAYQQDAQLPSRYCKAARVQKSAPGYLFLISTPHIHRLSGSGDVNESEGSACSDMQSTYFMIFGIDWLCHQRISSTKRMLSKSITAVVSTWASGHEGPQNLTVGDSTKRRMAVACAS